MRIGDSTKKLKKAIMTAFAAIKAEFDDHLESINQNTNEIQANYEYITRLETKIDKLSERVEELTMFADCKSGISYEVSELTTREKEVFLALYAAPKDLTYKEISRRTGLPENLVICYISNIATKGVPLQKSYNSNEVMLSIDPQFKEVQMKENIVGITESLSKTVST